MKPIQEDKVLDTRGFFCPEPIMMLHDAMREALSGEVVRVEATDPSTERDIPKFCKYLGHELLACESRNGEYNFWLKKGNSNQE